MPFNPKQFLNLQRSNSMPELTCTNLILSCGHILYGVPYNSNDHQIGEAAWCPNCGAASITEVESPYLFLKEEAK